MGITVYLLFHKSYAVKINTVSFNFFTDKVCELHFSPKDFNAEQHNFISQMGLRSYKTLKSDAIPSINLPFTIENHHDHNKNHNRPGKPLSVIAEEQTLMNIDLTDTKEVLIDNNLNPTT